MKIQLSDHFTYRKLIRFTLPSIVMMIFTSIYGVVDGFFLSNFVGKMPFAAANFIWPFVMVLGAAGFMFGTGGSALVAKTMGEGDHERANRYFSMLVYVSAAAGVVLTVVGLVVLRPVAMLMGAEGEMLTYCVQYGRILLMGLPFYILQMEFQSFFVTAEKPGLGLAMTVIAGVTNMVLDGLLVAIIPMGLVGAAAASAISQFLGGVAPIIYFARNNTSLLRLTKTQFDGRAMVKTCTNGSSELMSNISMSLINMLYNVQLLAYAGEDGVAAYGVLMYVNLIFLAAFIGYSIGTAPVVGYHYGAENRRELQSLLKKSGVIIGVFSVSMMLLSLILARPLSILFVGYDTALLNLTCEGFVIFSYSFLFAGYAIFGSGFFTALNDGAASALISFLRTLVFQVAAVMLLPLIWGTNGIWWSVVVAEAMAVAVSGVMLVVKRHQYGYFA